MKSSEIETTQMQSTSAYWGYRELNADEVMSVAGGYDGDNGPSGGFGGASQGNGPDSNNPGGSAGAYSDTQVAGFWRDVATGIITNILFEGLKGLIPAPAPAPAPAPPPPPPAPTTPPNITPAPPYYGSINIENGSNNNYTAYDGHDGNN